MRILHRPSPQLTNIELNAIPYWKARGCPRCKRHYPQTLLNVWGVLNRHESLQCVNRRACDEARKA